MLRGRRWLTASRRDAVGDLWIVAVAAAVVAGAWFARPVAWPVGVAVGVPTALVALVVRRPAVLALSALVVSSCLGAHAWQGTRPLPAGSFAAVVTLRTDPAPFGPGVSAEAIGASHHVQLRAFGGPARRLRSRLAGQQVLVEGRIRAPTGRDAWLRTRHVVGIVEVVHVTAVGDGSPLSRSANRVRRLLTDGAGTMVPLDRSLYLGFVIGDDRDQPVEVVQQFRASGLAHLSAVSGENVAFLLAVASPGLRRLGGPSKWVATVVLIAWFAVITRFEPSVIRAAVMAALSCTAVAMGRPTGTTRLLALTVVGVLLLDPLLVHDVGWWLSVGATTGIALLAAPLAVRLPGPAVLRAGLAVTVSAQLGVAPVSILVFGPLPLASIPANLLAVPVAGPVMVYGLPAGVVSALVPGLAPVLQLPTIVMVRWIALVAAWGAAAPLPALGPIGIAALAAVVAMTLCRRPRHRK